MTQNSFWILTVLARGRRHGYVRTVAFDVVLRGYQPQAVDAALDRLEAEGLILKDGEEIVDGRARRYYRLSDEGADALDDEANALEMRASIAKARLISMRSLGAGAWLSVPRVSLRVHAW